MACSAGPDVSESGLVLALDAGDRYSFTLTEVEVLVVAGGGAGGGYGGNDGAGGGGAGGLIYNRNFAVTPGSAVTVTVGAGGAGVGGAVRGNSGGNSVFGALTAIGGGGGGSEGAAEQRPGGSGGSGGGGGGYGVATGAGGNGTAGQGNAGGNCTAPGDGGGGGAGSPGESGLTGKGGLGLGFDISGFFVYYAGGGGASGDKRNARGGGGAIGGIGGGGKGQDATNSTPPENGSPNTGGGGGAAAGSNPTYGAGTTLTSGAGGSGIVIVRYPGPQRAIGGTVTFSGGHTIHTFTTVGSTTFTPLSASNGNAVLGLSDLSNTGNFGTTVNSPTYSSANGGSVSFGGSNEYVEILSNGKSSIFETQTFSIESIFYRTDDGENVLWSFDYTSHSGPYYSQHLRMSGNTLYFLWNNSSTYQNIGATVSNLNQWTSVTATFTSGFQGLYVNGSLVASSTRADTITYYNQEIWIGKGNYAGSEFSGRIASTKFYNRALTAAEVQQNFNSIRGRFGI